MIEKFTKMLYELLVKKNLSLKNCLEIITAKCSVFREIKNQNVIKKTAQYILDELMNGVALSNCLRRCPYISFDDTYIAFMSFAEKTGEYKDTITFLNNRCKRHREIKFKLFEAGIYPCIVILLAFVGVFYLQGSKLFNFSNDFYVYLGILVFICVLIFLAIKKLVGENKLYEAFLAVGFLLRAGINLYDAVGCGAQIIGVTSKKGQIFQAAREKLLLGMDIENAFCLGEKYADAFYFASKGGGKIDVFEKLAAWIGDEDEKKRNLCISFIEPLFILITGIFLIIIVVNVILPYFTNLTFI